MFTPTRGSQCSAILLGHDRQHCRFNPSPPRRTAVSPDGGMSRPADARAVWTVPAEVEEPPGPGGERFLGPSACQGSRERRRLLVLPLRAEGAERKGEAGPAARGDPRELPREGAAGPGRGLGASTSGVRWPVLPAGGHPDPLPGWLSAESGRFLPEAGFQRAGGVLCFLLSSGGILPLPAHLPFSLLPR